MTNEEIIKAAKRAFSLTWENPMCEQYGGKWVYKASESELLEFASKLHKDTIDKILTSLKEVPNPEVNRAAINRIMSLYCEN